MKKIKIGVIAAAGKGTRAYPKTSFIPKPLFRIENKSILAHNVELLIQKLKVEKIYILVGHLREQVIAEVESIQKEIKIPLVTKPWTTKGLASDVASLEEYIQDPFVLILGDEFYYKSNHEVFLKTFAKYNDLIASIGITKTSLVNRIRKNYSVELQGERIRHLVEKPDNPPNELLGLGSYLFTPEYFSYFKKTPPSSRSGVVEITEVIDNMAKDSGKVYSTLISCNYFNINSMQDFHHAVYEIRNDQFAKYKSSLIMSTSNSSRSISDVLVDFQGAADEILVVDADSKDDTVEVAKKLKAKVISSNKTINFGEQVREGIKYAKGDVIVIVSADGAFRAKDYPKFLEYLKDSDMVIGTRTTRQMIEQGSNLRPGIRILNLLMGKMIELFWWGQEPRFTDVDCHYLAVWKESYEKIKPSLEVKDKFFIPEMMIEFVRSHMRVIEIPVSFYKPVEQEKYTLLDAIKDSFIIFKMIIFKKYQ